MVSVAIIGTAGRSDLNKLNLELYQKMVSKSKYIIQNIFKLKPENIILISGGAAWSDHIIIDLFLESYTKNGLIYMPTRWENKKYLETSYKYDIGITSNNLHKKFSDKTGKKSLSEIQEAINRGLKINTNFMGFFNRNSQVAKADYIIAFSWSDTGKPSDGGTKNTWDKSKSKSKIHINLADL